MADFAVARRSSFTIRLPIVTLHISQCRILLYRKLLAMCQCNIFFKDARRTRPRWPERKLSLSDREG